jgi:hypothetical protein
LGAPLINKPANQLLTKVKTIGKATTLKTGRWRYVFYEYLYLGSKGCKEGKGQKEEMEMAE